MNDSEAEECSRYSEMEVTLGTEKDSIALYRTRWSSLFEEEEKSSKPPPPYSLLISLPTRRARGRGLGSRMARIALLAVALIVLGSCCLLCWWVVGGSSGRNFRQAVIRDAKSISKVTRAAKPGTKQCVDCSKEHSCAQESSTKEAIRGGARELPLPSAISPGMGHVTGHPVSSVRSGPAHSMVASPERAGVAHAPDAVSSGPFDPDLPLSPQSNCQPRPTIETVKDMAAPRSGEEPGSTPYVHLEPESMDEVGNCKGYSAATSSLVSVSAFAFASASASASAFVYSSPRGENVVGRDQEQRRYWTKLEVLPGTEDDPTLEYRRLQCYDNYRVPDRVSLPSFRRFGSEELFEVFHAFRHEHGVSSILVYAQKKHLSYELDGRTLVIGKEISSRFIIDSRYRLTPEQADSLAECAKLYLREKLCIEDEQTLQEQFIVRQCYLFHEMHDPANDHFFAPDWLATIEDDAWADESMSRLKVLSTLPRAEFVPSGEISLSDKRFGWLKLTALDVRHLDTPLEYLSLMPRQDPVDLSAELIFIPMKIAGYAEAIPVLIYARSSTFVETNVYRKGAEHPTTLRFERTIDHFHGIPTARRFRLEWDERVVKIYYIPGRIVGLRTNKGRSYPPTIPKALEDLRVYPVEEYEAFALCDDRSRIGFVYR